ncbi:unnamed protein product [Lathyrus oleraceus]
MIGNTSSGFSGLVTIGERIEQGLKNGKILDVVGASNGVRKFYGNFQKKKQGEASDVMVEGGRPCYAAMAHARQPQPSLANPIINIKISNIISTNL